MSSPAETLDDLAEIILEGENLRLAVFDYVLQLGLCEAVIKWNENAVSVAAAKKRFQISARILGENADAVAATDSAMSRRKIGKPRGALVQLLIGKTRAVQRW